jgi:hypothetical protein
MSGVLYFDCNYKCGEKIAVAVPWSECADRSGVTAANVVYAWVGKRVVQALVDHHLKHCTEYYKQRDGRPWLRLVTP